MKIQGNENNHKYFHNNMSDHYANRGRRYRIYTDRRGGRQIHMISAIHANVRLERRCDISNTL